MKTAKQLIDELRADGLTQGQIAEKTEITQATISRMQTGISEGRGATIRRLTEFHQAHFGAKAEAASSEQVSA